MVIHDRVSFTGDLQEHLGFKRDFSIIFGGVGSFWMGLEGGIFVQSNNGEDILNRELS